MLKTEEKMLFRKFWNYCNMFKNICFLTTFFIFSNVFYAQSTQLESKEQYFLAQHKKISENEDYEAKTAESLKFSGEFKKFIAENPETLTYDFKKLNKKLFIITSADKKLRFYVWDTELGGTMKSFDQVIQYSSNGKTKTLFTKDQTDTAYFVSEIIKIPLNNHVYYLVISNGVFSSKDQAQMVQAFTIKNNRLIDSDKIFKTKTTTLNKIQVDFDFFSVVDRPERPLKLIKFEKNKLYIPVVDKEGKVSDKFLIYQLNNNSFQYTGVQ